MTTEFSFEPLTPVSFLQRAGAVYTDRVAVIDGATRITYADLPIESAPGRNGDLP
jgi:non-ribosomal peptide synthetase component E (peptide arylation enzyme)